jgi:hypothetical protein
MANEVFGETLKNLNNRRDLAPKERVKQDTVSSVS